ncbi:unnamed protein product [Lampetra planeri]
MNVATTGKSSSTLASTFVAVLGAEWRRRWLPCTWLLPALRSRYQTRDPRASTALQVVAGGVTWVGLGLATRNGAQILARCRPDKFWSLTHAPHNQVAPRLQTPWSTICHHHTAWTLPGFPRLPIDGVHRPIRLAVGRRGKPG